MSKIIPPNRPRIGRADAEKIAYAYSVQYEPLLLLGIEGYYEDSMGKPDVNDRGIYDDCLVLLTPEAGSEWETRGKPRGFDGDLPTSGRMPRGVYTTFNFNTDPSRYRPGTGFGAQKGMMRVLPGLYFAHKVDLHKGKYEALCQRLGSVRVERDGINGPYIQEDAWVGANIHMGGLTDTWSEGCQTVPKPQFDEFMVLVRGILRQVYGFEDFWRMEVSALNNPVKRYLDVCVPYLKITETERRLICG